MFVAVAEPAREFALVIEQQALLGPPGDQVQREADAPEHVARFDCARTLARGDQPARDQVGERLRTEQMAAEPEHELQRAQSAGAFLEIGLQVVGGVVEARAALLVGRRAWR